MCRCRPIGHQFISIFETVKLSRPSGTLWNSRGAHFSCNIAKAINHQFSTRKSGDKKKKGTPPPSALRPPLRPPPPSQFPLQSLTLNDRGVVLTSVELLLVSLFLYFTPSATGWLLSHAIGL